MAADSDMQGRLEVPVITLHAIDDPTALVEYESDYREVVQRAGSQARLLQTFTREDQHSKLSDAEYAALFDALMKWIGTGTKPVVQALHLRVPRWRRNSRVVVTLIRNLRPGSCFHVSHPVQPAQRCSNHRPPHND